MKYIFLMILFLMPSVCTATFSDSGREQLFFGNYNATIGYLVYGYCAAISGLWSSVLFYSLVDDCQQMTVTCPQPLLVAGEVISFGAMVFSLRKIVEIYCKRRASGVANVF